jgi:uncharacterized protein (DUF2132 family)
VIHPIHGSPNFFSPAVALRIAIDILDYVNEHSLEKIMIGLREKRAVRSKVEIFLLQRFLKILPGAQAEPFGDGIMLRATRNSDDLPGRAGMGYIQERPEYLFL